MSVPTSSSSLLLPEGTDVPLEECFPVDDAPVRSVNCISWGPHNVLQVCTRWCVSFFLSSLLNPAQQRQIRHHSLCRRSELLSVEVAVGAKWSTFLLPEILYPASARLCVQSTSNLVVYRVARHGATRVEVSHGIGIACCQRGGVAAAASHSAGVESPNMTTAGLSDQQDADAGARKRKLTGKGPARPETKKAATATTRARQSRLSKADSSDSSSSSSSSSSSTSDAEGDSDGNLDSGAKTTPKRSATAAASKPRGRRAASSTAPDDVDDASTAETTDTNQAVPSPYSPACSSSRPSQSRPTPAIECNNEGAFCETPLALVDYLWLDNDDLVVLTTHGLHVVSFYGDLCDDDAPQVHQLPPPVYRWRGRDEVAAMGLCAPTPCCFVALSVAGLAAQTSQPSSALAFAQRTLVVASPYMLRVLHVSSTAGRPGTLPRVDLVHFMEVPSLTSVPTAVCAVGVKVTASVGAAVASTEEDARVEVVAFIAAPCRVLRGRWVLAASVRPSSLRRATWVTDATFGPEQLAGETYLRGLQVAPVSAEVSAPDASSVLATASSGSESSREVCTSVLGVGERSICQYALTGPSSVALLQCPLILGRSEVRSRKCASVLGVALHPCAAVAVVALQSGQVGQEPLHLWPVSVDGSSGWLRRFVDFAGVMGGDTDYDGTSNGVGHVEERRSTNDSYSAAAGTDSFRWSTQHMMARQVGASCFLRERLLPGSAALSSELHCYTTLLQQAQLLPSIKSLSQLRSLTTSRSSAAVASSIVSDLRLRHAYLQLRTQYGVSLFLRWPLSLSAVGSGDGQGGHGSCCSSLATAVDMAAKAVSWPWWRLLRHIWASCPWDIPVVHELVLSNAVCILAKRFRYANMAFRASEPFRESVPSAEPAACATDPLTVDIDGARCYIEDYVRHHEEVLRRAAAAVGGKNETAVGSAVSVLTAADCAQAAPARSGKEPSPTTASTPVHWCVSAAWVASLKDFLSSVTGAKKVVVEGTSAYPPPSSLPTHATSPSSLEHVRFPCSLCDRRSAATFHMSLSSTSQHVPFSAASACGNDAVTAASEAVVAHTTLFSGTTFSPLSFFSSDYVLTRCLSCGLSDYADGPLCRVCGGLLQ